MSSWLQWTRQDASSDVPPRSCSSEHRACTSLCRSPPNKGVSQWPWMEGPPLHGRGTQHRFPLSRTFNVVMIRVTNDDVDISEDPGVPDSGLADIRGISRGARGSGRRERTTLVKSIGPPPANIACLDERICRKTQHGQFSKSAEETGGRCWLRSEKYPCQGRGKRGTFSGRSG